MNDPKDLHKTSLVSSVNTSRISCRVKNWGQIVVHLLKFVLEQFSKNGGLLNPDQAELNRFNFETVSS